MSYESQSKLFYETLRNDKAFKKLVVQYREHWTEPEFYTEQITIKGQPIADKIIREMDIEGTHSCLSH